MSFREALLGLFSLLLRFFFLIPIGNKGVSVHRILGCNLLWITVQLWPRPEEFHVTIQGKATHPKNHPPKYKQFAQTVCANSFCLFSADFKGKRGAVCTNCPEIVCANCAFDLGGCFFGVGLPFMNNYSDG